MLSPSEPQPLERIRDGILGPDNILHQANVWVYILMIAIYQMCSAVVGMDCYAVRILAIAIYNN